MLKAVIELLELLEYSFQEGECQCIRCLSGEDPTAHPFPHNYSIDNKIFRRQFARSSKEDLLLHLNAAWKATYKETLDDVECKTIEKKLIVQMIGDGPYHRLHLLGTTNGLLSDHGPELLKIN